LSQVILIRRLLSVFYGNELTIGALLAGWMFWFGVGAVGFGGFSDRVKNPERALAAALFAAALIFPATCLCTWLVRYIFSIGPGVMAGLGTMLAASFALSAPVCILLAAGFNFAAKSFSGDEPNLVALYLYEALGSAAAGAASLGMAGRVPALAQVLFCSLVCALAGAAALERKKHAALSGIAAALVFIPLIFFSGRIERSLVLAQWPGQEVVLQTESKYSTITITREPGQTTFNLDGFPAFSAPSPEPSEYLVHLPLSMCGRTDRVLLIGGGLAPAAREVLKYPVKELVYVQIDPELTRLEEKYVAGFGEVMSSGRVRVVHQDGRSYLRENHGRFDAVILNLPGPETASLNRYYTREFFEDLSRNSGGAVLGLSVGTSGNYLSDGQAGLLANAVLTLQRVYPSVAVFPLGQNYLVASPANPLFTDQPDEIVARLQSRGIETKFVRDYFLAANLSPERMSSLSERLAGFARQPVNEDSRPRGYYLSGLLWLEQAGAGRRELIKKVMDLTRAPFYFLLAAFFAACVVMTFWRGRAAFAKAAIFGIGFAGMAAEFLLMLVFQAAYGYVFYLVGSLVAAFMAGLAAGAYLYQRFGARAGNAVRLLVIAAAGEAGAIAFASALLSGRIPSWNAPAAKLIMIFLALALIALFSGAAFPICARICKTEGAGMGSAAAAVNAWDHFGSAAGALLISAIIVPLFGLPFAFWFLGLLILGCILTGLALIAAGNP